MSTRSSIATCTRLVPRPRPLPPPERGLGSLARCIPLGLIAGGPYRPFSREISARYSNATCSSADTSLKSESTSAFTSEADRASRSLGGDIAPQNQKMIPRGTRFGLSEST